MNAAIKNAVLSLAALIERDRGPKFVFYHDVHAGNAYTHMSTRFSQFQMHIERAVGDGFKFAEGVPKALGELQICFDDGFRGLYECREYFVVQKLHPIVSVAPQLVGRAGYMTWEELSELSSIGFNIGSHTWSHRTLTEVPVNELGRELGDSRKMIADKIGRTVDSICFPRGVFSRRILDMSMEAGYRILYASVPGRINALQGLIVTEADNVCLYPRHLVQASGEKEFQNILNGAMNPFVSYYFKRHFKGGR